MLCAGCLNNVNETTSIGCIALTCSKRFCNGCAGISSMTNERTKEWLCRDCCALENDEEDSASGTPHIDSHTRPEPVNTVGTSDTYDVQNLLREISMLTQEINRCHERVNDLEAYISSNESRICPIESQERERENLEMEFLKCAIGELQVEMNMQMVNYLKYEIEFCGIPEFSDENVTYIILLLTNKLGVELSDQDIDLAARAGPRISNTEYTGNARRRPRPIVVRFLRRTKRDEIIKASKTRRNITSTDLSIPGLAQKVFINERLTHGSRLLFRQCRIQSKRMGYKFCWCNNGVIYVREREGKSAIILRSYEDLGRLVDKKNKSPNNTSMP